MIELPPDELKQLIIQLKAGNNRAYNRLQHLVRPWLYGVIYQYLGRHKDEVDDVYQDVMLNVFRAIEGFREDGKLSTWICRIAINRCRNRHRHHKVRKKEFEEPFDDATLVETPRGSVPRPDEVLQARQRQKVLNEALSVLGDDYREIWILRIQLGLSYEEIGAILSLPDGTVRSRLHRAKKEVQHCMKKSMTSDADKEG